MLLKHLFLFFGRHKFVYFVLYYRTRQYFSDVLNFLDAVIIVVTLVIDFICIFYDLKFLIDIPR